MASRAVRLRASALVLAVVGFAVGTQSASAQIYYWSPESGGNGHVYEYIDAPSDWATANAAANARTFAGSPGHLATISTAAENTVVHQTGQGDDSFSDSWIGAFQPPGSGEPADNFQWVTGEPFNYANWNAGQPDNFNFNYGDDDVVAMVRTGFWYDFPAEVSNPGSLVEYDSPGALQTVAATVKITQSTSILNAELYLSGEPLNANLTGKFVGEANVEILYKPGAVPVPLGVRVLDSRADLASDVHRHLNLGTAGSVDIDLEDAAARLIYDPAPQGTFEPVRPDGTFLMDEHRLQYLDGLFTYDPHGAIANLINPGQISLPDDIITFRLDKFSPGLLGSVQFVPTVDPKVFQLKMHMPIYYRSEILADLPELEIAFDAQIDGTAKVTLAVPEPSSVCLALAGGVAVMLVAVCKRRIVR